MIDRRLIGDIAIAVPSVSLAQPDRNVDAKRITQPSEANSPNAAIAPDRNVGMFR